VPNSLWYRHRNRVVDRVVGAVEHVFSLDEGSGKPSLQPAARA